MEPLIPVIILVFIFYCLVELITHKKTNQSQPEENNHPTIDTNHRSMELGTVNKTSEYFDLMAGYFNMDDICYIVDRNGNRFTWDFVLNEREVRVIIHLTPNYHKILYSIVILRDFPDERLHKLSELIVRLNNHFVESKFSMFMESRSITFDLPFNMKHDRMTHDIHINTIRWLVDIYEKHETLFVRVAFNDEEPIAVMMDLPQ